MKKIIIIVVITLLILTFFCYLFFLNKNKVEVIIEDYTDVVISESLILEVYNEYKISDFISIKDGKILNDKLINTDNIGKKNIEVIYLDKEEKKKKAFFNVNIVDTKIPIILGSSTYSLLKGSEAELEHLMISLDNYTKTPIREIIGVYDINTLGSYKLTFKITDESNNFNTKDFTLNVVSKLTPRKPITTKTIYDDIVSIHKNDSTKIGLDISKWQGDVDFDKLKEKNVEFIMIRVGYQKGFDREYIIDNKFIRNISEANRVGIPVGIYMYTYTTSKEIAKEQALWIIDKIKDYRVELPIAFDFEDWETFSKLNLSQKDINDIAREFMKTIEDNGYKGINYSSKYYLENIWNIEDYPVWLAHYTTKTDYKGKYAMWQLCQDGRIDGIYGAVDINVLYDNSIIK